MKLETIKLNDLNPAEYNPRTITKQEFEGLKESLKAFGQQENLIVNKDMMICYNSIMANKDYFYKLWRESPERRAKNRTYKNIARFGFDVDGYREAGNCAMCGITNQQCKDRYSKSLSIDHINNQGRSRYTKELDNNIKNLQLLCQSCHTIKTNKVDSNYKYEDPNRGEKIWNTRYKKHPQLRIKYNGKNITATEYAKAIGKSRGYVYFLIKEGKINAKTITAD